MSSFTNLTVSKKKVPLTSPGCPGWFPMSPAAQETGGRMAASPLPGIG